MGKKDILFWLVDLKGEPFQKKGKKGTTGQLGNGHNYNSLTMVASPRGGVITGSSHNLPRTLPPLIKFRSALQNEKRHRIVKTELVECSLRLACNMFRSQTWILFWDASLFKNGNQKEQHPL